MRFLTTLCLSFGIILVLFWPWALRHRPPKLATYGVNHELLGAYQVMFVGYAGSAICAFLTAGCLAFLLIRQTREEFAAQRIEVVKKLVEGSMEDLRKKGDRP